MSSLRNQAYKKFTRWGFVVKGIIYILSGLFALIAAIGPGGRTVGRLGVVRWLNQKPLDATIFILILLGLCGYILLRFMQAIKDTNHKGSNWKGVIKRSGYLISGLIYLMFMVAGSYILFPRAGVWEEDEVSYVKFVLSLPTGNFIVGTIGVISAAYGVLEIVRAFKGSFKNSLSVDHLSESRKKMIVALGTTGYLSRGIILSLTGYFVFEAAVDAYQEETGFTSQAYEFLSYILGNFMMGTVATGFAIYGIFMFIKAKYYQVSVR